MASKNRSEIASKKAGNSQIETDKDSSDLSRSAGDAEKSRKKQKKTAPGVKKKRDGGYPIELSPSETTKAARENSNKLTTVSTNEEKLW